MEGQCTGGSCDRAVQHSRTLRRADLPVIQSTKFETVLNLNTANALGIKISDNLLSLVDDLME